MSRSRVVREGWWRRESVGLFALSMILLLIGAMFGRPLWIDESLQFALAGFDRPSEAWRAFVGAMDSISMGQTGAYFMADFFLLKLFGASSFWLRFPSYVAGGFLFASAISLLGIWGVTGWWRAWALVALFCQPWVADFLCEARSYMPLAAAVIATYAYYALPVEDRGRIWPRVLGAGGVLVGALFHPYFSVYWAFVCLFAFAEKCHAGQAKPTLRAFTRHCNLALCASGALVYFGLGSMTWMTHQPKMTFDPFQWVPKQFSVGRYLFATHFLFLKKLKTPMAILFVAVGAMLLASPRKWKQDRRDLLSAIGLVLCALLVSALLSYMSYRSRYWILERQWIASIALVTLATARFSSALSRRLDSRARAIWVAVLFGFLAVVSAGTASYKVKTVIDWHRHREDFAGWDERRPAPAEHDNGAWEKLSRANIASGGRVWPVFRKYYTRER